MISLAALWIFASVTISTIETQQRARIAETLAFGEELFYGQSEEALIDAIAGDGEVVWSDDDIYWVLEEAEQIFVFRDAEGELIAGYEALWAGEEIEQFPITHPEIEGEVRAQSVILRGGSSITVGEFVPDDHYEVLGFATFGTYSLILIVLPLALITGYFLSRSVFNRIEGVSETAAAVAQGEMTRRAPVTGKLDEFDRLAMGINQMLDKVDTLNSNIEAVSVGVAHDLKTPLANLGGRLELIRRDLSDGGAIEKHVETAENYLAQVLRIFDAILRLGEVEAGGRRSAFQAVDIGALVRDMADTFQPVFEDAHKTLKIEVTAEHQLMGDQELLQQMVANLLENALEHSRDAAKVTIRLHKSPTLALEVEDDGPGIAAPDREKIFDRFYRADSSRSSPGNGLGLSLVKAIADLHDAEATLVPSDSGAHFRVTFGQ